MPSTYSPTAVPLTDITLPADGDPQDAASVNAPLEAIADGVKNAEDQVVAEIARATAAEAAIRPGRLLAVSVLTTTGTFTTGANTTKLRIRGVGGGGGGGGAVSASGAGAGGGGGAGSYVEATFDVAPSTGYDYTVGAAGGTAAAGGPGLFGGSSTFDAAGTTVTAPGGNAAPAGSTSTSLTTTPGGAVGSLPTNGTVNVPGSAGAAGLVLNTTGPVGLGGAGASGPFGAGAAARMSAGDGVAATGYGAGGGGCLTGASTARSGGAGSPGVWIVEEYS
jgi:hypothetical protein